MKSVATALLVLTGVSSLAARQGTNSARDQTIIERAKNTDVSLLEKTLPQQKLVDWLQKVAGEKAVLTWRVTDCGEASGGPADATRDMPVCAEVTAKIDADR